MERNDILEVCIKHFKYLSEKYSIGLTQEEEDFMKTMQEIDTLYKSELNRARLEGEHEGEQRGEVKQGQTLILRLLNRRVGNLSIIESTSREFVDRDGSANKGVISGAVGGVGRSFVRFHPNGRFIDVVG